MTQASPELPHRSNSGKTALEVSVQAARLAGGIIKERFNSIKEINFKGVKDIVTDVDLAAEKAILGLLKEEFPDFGVLAEESAPLETASPFTWVVDPLDGTRNYAAGVPHFCTVVALSYGDTPVVGVTYDPMRDEMFTAEQGKGAFLNGDKLEISENTEVKQALLCCDLGYVDEKAGLALDLIRSLWPDIISIRLMGSSALGVAYAAANRVDLYFHHSLSPWDIASGHVLIQEAGGIIVDKQGQPANLRTPSVIASNPQLVSDFLKRTNGHPWRSA